LRVASDTHLVDLVRQGRGAAFEALYDRHHRAILSFCRHMLGSADEAEDAVQHTFLAAYNDLIASDREMYLRAWLFTIARNRCYSVLRARREQPVADLDESATEGLAAQVERRQDLRDLVLDLSRLPDEQRAALVLSEMDSLSHEQIGQVLGVPKDKVKALVFQARESLIASRAARETDCSVIREQLANLHGGALRRANLRRHLHECPGCREFRDEVDRQRKSLRVLLPVAPTLALKETILGATAGGTATGTAAAVSAGTVGGGTVAGSLFKGGVIKGLIGAALAGVGTAGTIVAVHDFQVSNGATPHREAAVSQLRSPAPATVARTGHHAVVVSSTTSHAVGLASARGATGATRSSASWTAAVSGGGHRSASATPGAVLHPFSSSGLSGSKPSTNPLAPSTPTVGVTPPANSGTSGNAPYLGSSAFGKGTQPTPSSPSAPATSTPSAPTSSSSPTTSTPTPITSSQPSGSTGTGSTHTGTGGDHFANPTGSGSTTPGNGGSTTRTGSGSTPSGGSSGTTPSSTPSSSSTSTTSTPTTSTTGTTTTTTPTAPAPTEPTGTGGRSGGSSGTSTSGGSDGYGGGAPGGGGR
jgi:RNA polymerase sigma factor (sigma-70 family)